MADDVSGQDAFAAALSGAEPPVVETGPSDVGGQDAGQGGEPQVGNEGGGAGGEGQGQQPPVGAEGGQQPGERQPSREDAQVPSWRLREIREQLEAERQAAAKHRQEAEQYRRYYEHQQAEEKRKQEEQNVRAQDLYASQDPNAHIAQLAGLEFQNRFGQMAEPFQRQIISQIEQQRQQDRIEDSLEIAVEKHGQQAVSELGMWLNHGLRTNPEQFQAIKAAAERHRRPYMELFRIRDDINSRQEIGPDLNAFKQRFREESLNEALRDPAFLQRALEAARAQATPVQTGVPGRGQSASQPRGGMPSLNRASGAADDAGESDDPQAVFQAALAAGRR